MRGETFCEILEQIDPAFIQEARQPAPAKKGRWPRLAAACLGLIVLGTALLTQLPGSPLYRAAGGGVSGGMWPEGVDPVTASLAVFPATEDVTDVASAAYEELDQAAALALEGLGEHLPGRLPDGLSFHYAALYETTMKDGTQYHLLRAFYTDGEMIPGIVDGETGEVKPDQPHDALAVFVMDYQPDTHKTIHRQEDLPAFLAEDWDGSTFHFICGEVYLGVTVNSGALSIQDILTAVGSVR